MTDKKTGASHTSEEWVKVVNIPPRFSDIEVKVENIDQDPMRINLQMQGAKDPDGVIRSYTWYYYTSTDEQPQGFRITTKPETSFTLPKINGRYYFSVVLEDANGLRVDTRDISENKFSTPDLLVNQNISTPIIEFTASTKDAKYGDPVELSVTAKNALGQDITKVVEYRWDVDGDGFYDIKTTENVLSYKYTVPGEYHPKVKVTHRGLSTTKFLTVTVTNRLIPQAQVQVIGDKIIAYNTSTGIIQSVGWYVDNVKVSENKDYLLYTPTGTFPKQLRLEITDGQDIQNATIPLERNPQNKVLVRKAGRPLVVLTNENNSVTPATDDVIWSDPVKPLFFYLGESEGEIQYYVIDNDIDVDTDLSGGKNDDADNK
ncbi:PKD domain-containing protein [Candidatus Peribacteria bacterium]|nr:PKD domain-containing protein [Candidatus Peribacteria bacterium]